MVDVSAKTFKLKGQNIFIDNCQTEPARKYTLLNVPFKATVEGMQQAIRNSTGNPNVMIQSIMCNKLVDSDND